MPAKAPEISNQHARFLETARVLGCDEDEAVFDEKLKAVVGPKTKLVGQRPAHDEREGQDASKAGPE